MKYPLLAIALTLFLSGCSSTWEGVKDDSSDIWNDTKETINDATD
ncbi:entericidin EcnAB [Marinomonas piezotolerans]|uniref:Entericidin EcnAB n=1 Tax=Marinomonas piezotolerans TaxID=2213058 RepID=A0A370UAN8_9GAMM|nr:entericidin EcnAB [Marinomonas piezotolerans]RDL44849.1 entericidin EcnAB [Marinomonas piezotolerans]